MSELDELIALNEKLLIVIDYIDKSNAKFDTQNSVIEVQNSTINSQIEVLNFTLTSQIEVDNSNLEIQNSKLEVQNSVINSSLDTLNSVILYQGVTQNSYNDVFVSNNVTFKSEVLLSNNLIQYQNNKSIQLKSFDFIFFGIIISALLVLIIIKGLKNV